MSDASQVQVGIIEEVTPGVTPSNPEFEILRTVDTSGLSVQPITAISRERRADRRITDLARVGKDISGSINMEFSFKSLDRIFEGVLRNGYTNMPVIVNSAADTEIEQVTDSSDTFTVASGGAAFVDQMLARTSGFTNAANNGVFEVTSSTGTTVVMAGTPTLVDEAAPPKDATIRAVGFVGASGDITATTSGGNALLSSTLDYTTMPLVPGQWLKVGGTASGDKFDTGAVNALVRVSADEAITANRLPLDIVPAGWATDAGGSKTIKVWFGDYIREGVADRSYSIERWYKSQSPNSYRVFTGIEFDNVTVSISSAQIITVSATLVGRDGTLTTVRISGATDLAPNTNSVMNATSDVEILYEGGAEIGATVLEASLSISNGLRKQTGIKVDGASGFGKGQANIQTTKNVYFTGIDILNKVMNNTKTSFVWGASDADNQMMIFDTPLMKYASGAEDDPGAEGDLTADLTGQVLMHETLGYELHIQRFHYFEK